MKTVGDSRNRSGGFTLIEVLLAMVVTIMVLATCGMLYFSIAQAWISHKQGDAELQHTHSIFSFLEKQLSLQPLIPSDSPDEFDPGIRWAQLPEASSFEPHYLSWQVETLPVFLKTADWMDEMGATLYLKYDASAGLAILWHPDDSRIGRMDFTNYNVTDHIFEFPIALNMVSFSYGYWDAEDQQWETELHTRNYSPGDRGVPDAVILEIEEREVVTRTLYIGKEGGSGESG